MSCIGIISRARRYGGEDISKYLTTGTPKLDCELGSVNGVILAGQVHVSLQKTPHGSYQSLTLRLRNCSMTSCRC